MKMLALTSTQGTAMGETAICDTHPEADRNILKRLAHRSGDWDHGDFHDCSGNEALTCQMCGAVVETGWSRADRAAAALQAHVDEVAGFPGADYGDEGSEEFDDAVMSLLVDLKHLLWRAAGPAYELTAMAEKAIDIWSEEDLPEGGDEEEDDD